MLLRLGVSVPLAVWADAPDRRALSEERPPTDEILRGRMMTEEGEMLRHLTLDPTRNYQAIGEVEVSTMS
jgi:hypothetical protein